MKFIIKTTKELTFDEKQAILVLFKRVFNCERSLEELNNQYQQNALGYSYHSLFLVNDELVGLNSFIPDYYYVEGEKKLFVNSVDTMINNKHRGIENFFDLINSAFERLSEDGVSFVLGFPNDISYPVFSGTRLMLDIGKLNTYILPFRVGGIKRGLRFLNPFSKLFSRCWLAGASIFASSQNHKYMIHKDDVNFNITRYKRMDGKYSHVNLHETDFYYKLMLHESVRTLFFIDITKKSALNFCRAIKYLIKREKDNFDLLLYVGNLPFNNHGMIKLPRKYEPKKFNFMGKSISKNKIDNNVMYNIHNWDVNLSNYDLL